MNEKVAELAERAAQESALIENDMSLEVSVDNSSYMIPASFIEKFAELLVAECCLLLTRQGEQWENFAKNPPEGQGHTTASAMFTAYRLKEDAVSYLEEYFGY